MQSLYASTANANVKQVPTASQARRDIRSTFRDQFEQIYKNLPSASRSHASLSQFVRHNKFRQRNDDNQDDDEFEEEYEEEKYCRPDDESKESIHRRDEYMEQLRAKKFMDAMAERTSNDIRAAVEAGCAMNKKNADPNDVAQMLMERHVEEQAQAKLKQNVTPNPWLQNTCPWAAIAKQMSQKCAMEEQQRRERLRYKTRAEAGWEQMYGAREARGYKALALLKLLLDSFGYERSQDQVTFHDAMIITILPKLFGDEWATNSVHVMEQFKLQKIDYEVAIMCARRWGKTMSVAMFLSAVELAVPIKATVFSTGSRASGSIMGMVIQMVKSLPGCAERICGENKEQLYIAQAAEEDAGVKRGIQARSKCQDPTTSVLYSYPGATTSKPHKHTHTRMLFHGHTDSFAQQSSNNFSFHSLEQVTQRTYTHINFFYYYL